MAYIKSLKEVTLEHQDYWRRHLPNADIKPGSALRDMFIDCPSSQIAMVYRELETINGRWSVKNYFGTELEDFVAPFGIKRSLATPASGYAIATFSSLSYPFNVDQGSSVTATNNVTFAVANPVYVNTANASYYKAFAQQYQSYLDDLGITDPYAVRVNIVATISGTIGNIGKYGVRNATIAGINNIFNPITFSNGTDKTSDTALQNQFLTFINSVSGTALGIYSVVTGIQNVTDAYIVEPGDTLMTRDGSVIGQDSSGNDVVLEDGTGGKVDAIVLGQQTQQNLESYIYIDKSNKNDPTNPLNARVLGQIPADKNKTIITRRRDNLKNKTLPTQPVTSITQVIGSSSGANYLPKSVDQYGRVSGNYDLIKDTGDNAGTPWALDKMVWLKNNVTIREGQNKGAYNSQDPLNFTDVIDIPSITQNVLITNENSVVDASDNSIIHLYHYPVSSVSRVFNATKGETYSIISLNLNSDKINTTGQIQISGQTLPSATDVLQVDYVWVVSYDGSSDYDGKLNTYNSRPSTDSVDWSYSNQITELVTFNATSSAYDGYTEYNIGSIISINQYDVLYGTLVDGAVVNSVYAGRLAVIVPVTRTPNLNITKINSVRVHGTGFEIFNTNNSDYYVQYIRVSTTPNVYHLSIVFPSDVNQNGVVAISDTVKVFCNKTDVSKYSSFSANKITIPQQVFTTSVVEVNYLCDSSSIISTNPRSLAAYRNGNGFVYTYALPKSTTTSNVSNLLSSTLNREYQNVQTDGSNLFITLNPDVTNYMVDQILSAIRVSDGLELISATTTQPPQYVDSGSFKIILTQNTPVLNDVVLVTYTLKNLSTLQPISNQFQKVHQRVATIDSSNQIVFTQFVAETGVSVKITNTKTLDQYTITGNISIDPDGSSGRFTPVSFSWLNSGNVNDFYTMTISSSINDANNGTYECRFGSSAYMVMKIANRRFIQKSNISVVDMVTGAELWSTYGSINISTNTLTVFGSNIGRKVLLVIGRYQTLRKSANRVGITTKDTVNQIGSIKLSGITLSKANYITTVINANSLKLNLQLVLQQALSDAGYSNTVVSGIAKVEKIELVDAIMSVQEVVSTKTTYDVAGIKLQTNVFDNIHVVEDLALAPYEVVLPASLKNSANLPQQNLYLSISFYFYVVNDSETIKFNRNATIYTNKKFAVIDSINALSGFDKTNSAVMTTSLFTQPNQNSIYYTNYSYIAPKANERITILNNSNGVITSATLAVFAKSAPNTDILIKEAESILVDITVYIVVLPTYIGSEETVRQNVYDTVISSATLTQLGAILDQSDLISAIGAIAGVDRVRITQFNRTGEVGQILSVTSKKNQYILPGTLTVNVETR